MANAPEAVHSSSEPLGRGLGNAHEPIERAKGSDSGKDVRARAELSYLGIGLGCAHELTLQTPGLGSRSDGSDGSDSSSDGNASYSPSQPLANLNDGPVAPPEAVDTSASQPAHFATGNASYSPSQPLANPNDGPVVQPAVRAFIDPTTLAVAVAEWAFLTNINNNIIPQPARTTRDAMVLAETTCYNALPLLAECLLPSRDTLLAGPHATLLAGRRPCIGITAEKIHRIPSDNHPGQCRVDFFMYCADGSIVRFHPGFNDQSTMRPHLMPAGSCLFDGGSARVTGVGGALHSAPPGYLRSAGAPQLGDILFNVRDTEAIATYDTQMFGWRRVRHFLDSLPNTKDWDIDWSDGSEFPWWLWIANPGKTRKLIGDGIISVKAICRDQVKSLQVTSLNGRWEKTWSIQISDGIDRKMLIKEM